MLNKFTIYGERCSGTTYLEQIVKTNFKADITWEYGCKHFFGFHDLTNSNDTLFICIVRNPYDWINSFYKNQYHLPIQFKNKFNFLNNEFYSINKENIEMKNDHNIYTSQRYSNIFELRHIKLKFLIETLPLKVTNYLFIKYEDLLDNFNGVMDSIKDKGLIPKNNIYLNNFNYKGVVGKVFDKNKKIVRINFRRIYNKFIPYFEKKLKYI